MNFSKATPYIRSLFWKGVVKIPRFPYTLFFRELIHTPKCYGILKEESLRSSYLWDQKPNWKKNNWPKLSGLILRPKGNTRNVLFFETCSSRTNSLIRKKSLFFFFTKGFLRVKLTRRLHFWFSCDFEDSVLFNGVDEGDAIHFEMSRLLTTCFIRILTLQ